MNKQEQKNFYETNGYLILNKAINEETCDYFFDLFKKYSVEKNNINWGELLQIQRNS